MIEFYCIRCGQYLEAEDDTSGAEGNCPACQALITVPGTKPDAPAPAPDSIPALDPVPASVASSSSAPASTPALAVTTTAPSPPSASVPTPAPEPAPAPAPFVDTPTAPIPVVAEQIIIRSALLSPPPPDLSAPQPLPPPPVESPAVPDAPPVGEAVPDSPPAPPAETPAGDAPQDPPARPQWQPKPWVDRDHVPSSDVPSLRMSELPAPIIGGACLVGGALLQVGILLLSDPESVIRQKCREGVLFLFLTFAASVLLAVLLAYVLGSLWLFVMRLLKRDAHILPVFCVTVLAVGFLLLGAGIVWHGHGLSWLPVPLNTLFGSK